jgi:ribosomal protein S18 acetylase RimI-like enzyme
MTRLQMFDDIDATLARSLVALQQQSYAVEAALIGVAEIPPMRQTEQDLLDGPERWILALEGEDVVAAIAWEQLDDGTIDIVKLIVRPDCFRRGLAGLLLDALDRIWPSGRFIVATGEANTPARRLYEQRGFRIADRMPIGHDTWIVTYVRDAGLG